MECNRLEKYLTENGCSHTMAPGILQQHLEECTDCKKYHRFISALELQKESLQKAPADILPNVEKIIYNSIGSRKKEPFSIYTPLFKPALAGFFALLFAVVAYTVIADKNVGYVVNLSKRFKLSQFENINSGDLLYAGDNTTADIRLKSDNKFQIHQNTIVKVDGARQISLSRGAISLQAGRDELRIATPVGLLLARNATAKMQTVSRLENGVVKTETTCMVFTGNITIKSPLKETVLLQGQKTTVAENGSFINKQQLSAAEYRADGVAPARHTLFAAVESLCDCITTPNYAPGKKADHLRLFGREVDENKFKVRVFWQEKGQKGLVSAPAGENNRQCSANITKMRRVRA